MASRSGGKHPEEGEAKQALHIFLKVAEKGTSSTSSLVKKAQKGFSFPTEAEASQESPETAGELLHGHHQEHLTS